MTQIIVSSSDPSQVVVSGTLQGPKGYSVLNGSGAPGSGLGDNGDFYIDTTAHSIYGPKTSGAWGAGTSLIGPTGNTGATGTAGSTWYSGSGAPSGGTGVNGDYYFRTSNDDIYLKSSGSWSVIANIKGSTGATGATGATGTAATIAAGVTTTTTAGTNANVTNSGSSSAAVFDFDIPRGVDGTNAGFKFNFASSTSMADPGTGNFRLNNATIASAIAIAIDDTSADTGNPDVSAQILTWAASTNTNKGTLTIRKISAPATFATFAVTGLTDNSGWTEVALTYVAGNGTLIAADPCVLVFSRTGDKGADGTGSGDFSGPASATDNAVVRFDGTTGKLGQNSAVTIADTSGNITGGTYNGNTIGAGATSGTNTGDQTLPTRASLALDTTDSPQFAGVNIGHASDTTVTRTSAGNIAVEGNAIYRAGGTDVPVADGGTGASTKAAGFDALSPMTTSGDVIYGGASGTGTRLAKGSDGDILTLASGLPSWAAPAASGGTPQMITTHTFAPDTRYAPNNVGTSTVAQWDYRGAKLDTGANANSATSVMCKNFGGQYLPFARTNTLSVMCAMLETPGTDSIGYVGVHENMDSAVSGSTPWIDLVGYHHYGFKSVRTSSSTTTYCTNANASSETTTSFSPTGTNPFLVGATYNQTNIKFYERGTLRATHTTNLPSASTSGTMGVALTNKNVATNATLRVGSMSLSQDIG